MQQTRGYLTVAALAVFLATLVCSATASVDVSTVVTLVPGPELDTVPTTDQGNINSSVTIDESFSSTSPLLESYAGSQNVSDDEINEAHIAIEKRFEEIRKKALESHSYGRRELSYPKCCLEDTGTVDDGLKCVIYFIQSEQWNNFTIETYPLKICSILYSLNNCEEPENEETARECVEYCQCFSRDPVLTIVSDAATALDLVCILLTLCVYASVPRLRNLYGKCLMSYLVALLASEAFATAKSRSVCSQSSAAVDYLLSFFSLARYGWVNMLCVDVCCVCRSFYSVRQPAHKLRPQGRRKFVYYSLAVWGGTALLFTVIHILPDFESTVANLVVTFLLVFSSCVPLIVTLKRIWRTNNHCHNQLTGVTRRKLCWFYMTSKLMFISGIGKILAVIIYVTVRGTPYYDWLPIFLKLEGPLLFILFVCNYRVRGRVRERLSQLDWIS